MTKLTDGEPGHWHTTDADGRVRHNMNDPRRFDIAPAHWNTDERAYVEHLTAHESQAATTEPQPGDHELVRTVLAYIASERRRVDGLLELVLTLRQELASGVAIDESPAAKALKQLWPTGGPTPPAAAVTSTGTASTAEPEGPR